MVNDLLLQTRVALCARRDIGDAVQFGRLLGWTSLHSYGNSVATVDANQVGTFE